MQEKNIVIDKSLEFAIEIVKFCELLDSQKKFVIANQLLKSGTSVGANVFEAQHVESRADFVHKMKLAIKEANETLYWLLICEKTVSYPGYDESLKLKVEELVRIISSIILTSRSKF